MSTEQALLDEIAQLTKERHADKKTLMHLYGASANDKEEIYRLMTELEEMREHAHDLQIAKSAEYRRNAELREEVTRLRRLLGEIP